MKLPDFIARETPAQSRRSKSCVVKKKPFPHGNRFMAGLTVVELLVVMVIISLIAALAVSAYRSVNSAMNLSTAAQTITSEITIARQTALTDSEAVEVRFYLYPDAITGTDQFQAVQTFSTTDGSTYTALDKISYLPVNVMIDQTIVSPTVLPLTALSYPFGESNAAANPGPYTPNGTVSGTLTSGAPATLPGSGVSYTYKTLRFKASGAVDYLMPTNPPTGWPPAYWYITLYEKKYSGKPTTSIKNFVTISVDSTDGRVRTFQP
jgi:uncharacterized protein (TIGR02596 family)